MSIKELIDSAKHLLSELKVLMSDLMKAVKDFASWLYHREWTGAEFVIVFCIIGFFILVHWIKSELKTMAEKKKQPQQPSERTGEE